MPTIFDNIDEYLSNDLLSSLESSYRADFCVGYFNLRGWKNISHQVDQFQGGEGKLCRVLIGMQKPEEELVREFFSLEAEPVIDQPKAISLKKKIATEFRNQLTFGIPKNDDEQALRVLSEQLKIGKVKVKLFLKHSLHAKLYLCFRNDKKTKTIGYVGSSNLTLSGLKKQGELNVDVVDVDATKKLENWFEDRWEDRLSIDITDELAQIIDESWAGENLTPPYLIYLKIAYHLSKDAQIGENSFQIPKEFSHLLPFQKEAVTLAAQHLHNRNGVMIGDVVGLGKTMTASALAKVFEETFILETLIICPKNLVPMWEDYIHNYRLRARVKSISKIDAKWLENERRYRLMIIDESHNLRNREGKKYALIKDYIDRNDPKVILLTATPYNKNYKDVSNQLRLFIPEDLELGICPERYIEDIGGHHEYIAEHQTSPYSIAAFEHSEYIDDWRDLLKLYLVRRTRSFIKDNYAQEDESNGRMYLSYQDGSRFYFPERLVKRVDYDFDPEDFGDVYSQLFSEEVVYKINKLNLPRYGLGNFIDETKAEDASALETQQLNNLTRAGKRLMGFCRTNLYKRLESSGYSFLLSLARHAMRNHIFLYAIENNLELPIGSQETSEMDEFLEENDEQLAELGKINIYTDPEEYQVGAAALYGSMKSHPKKFGWISPGYFKSSLKKSLKKDNALIMEVLSLGEYWDASNDKQIDALEKLVNDTHRKEKVLIFTQFADTARYIEKEFKRRKVDSFACVTGGTDNPSESVRRFSPVSNNVEGKVSPVRILITTDVLSEGQNLQDSHIIVNFDLPWALIRLIQRAGRVDRIGQKSDKIYCYSFLPAEGVETIIRLRSRLQNRIQENSELIGADETFFDGDPVNLRDLYNEKSGILDEEDNNEEVDLTSLAYEIWNQAIKANPSLKNQVLSLPNVVYATKEKPTDVTNNGVITYHKSESGMDMLTWLDDKGIVKSRSLYKILKVLECSLDTPALEKIKDHHFLVGKAMSLAKQMEKTEGGHLGKRSSVRYKTYMQLKRHYEEQAGTLFENTELKKAIDEIYKYPMQENAKSLLNRRIRLGLEDEELANLVIDMRNEGRLCNVTDGDASQQREAQIICSMGLKSIEDGN